MNGLSSEIIKELFPFNENTIYNAMNTIYNAMNKRKFHSTVFFGSETLSYLAPIIWELLPVENIPVLVIYAGVTKN